MSKRSASIMLALVTTSIGVFILFPPSASSVSQKQPSAAANSNSQLSMDSPFGASGAFSRPFMESDHVDPMEVMRRVHSEKEPYQQVQDIGIKWIRPGSDIYWRTAQPNLEFMKNGLYDWRFLDDLYGRVPAGVNILGTIDPMVWMEKDPAFKPGTWQFSSDELEEYYVKFVKEVVERYGPRGNKQMPGLANPIKYWQIGNEPALRPLMEMHELTRNLDPRGFSHIVEITYKAVKEVDPEAKIALAGLMSGSASPDDPVARREREEFYIPLLQMLRGKSIDIFDIHYYGLSGQQPQEIQLGWGGMKNIYSFFRHVLDENGFKNTKIWFTETGSVSIFAGETQERLQACDLVRRYIHPLSFGAKKIFWWNIIEGDHPLGADTPSNYLGLIYDGLGRNDLGYGVKKLAYYTYKKMVEVLEGSDWDSIETIRESDGIYIYKFSKKGKPVWVAWNDGNQSKKVILKLDKRTTKVKITEAVPRYESGQKVENYGTAFREVIRTDISESQPPQVVIEIGSVPLFAEEL